MLIKNAEVYTQEHRFVKENVEIKNGRFSAISGEVSKDTEVVEAEGLYIADIPQLQASKLKIAMPLK